MTQVSSGLITTHALISAGWLPRFCARANRPASEKLNPSARPPLAAAVPTAKVRRESSALRPELVFMVSSLCQIRRQIDRCANALIGAATTDIGHRSIDLL